MTFEQIEDLFIQSLDSPLRENEQRQLAYELQHNPEWAKRLSGYEKIRKHMRHTEGSTYGPYFASKLIAKIQNTRTEVERQIFIFFKKYQLAAFGIIAALVILNTFFSDSVTIDSIFGVNDTMVPSDEIVSFDFYETLNTIL